MDVREDPTRSHGVSGSSDRSQRRQGDGSSAAVRAEGGRAAVVASNWGRLMHMLRGDGGQSAAKAVTVQWLQQADALVPWQ
eukprot:11764231-Alexandrium_andersonii.AAC.1